MELSVRLRKSGTILDLIVACGPWFRHAIIPVQLSPDVLFELVQVVVHDTDLTAIQTLVEHCAALQETGISDQRTGFIG